MVAARVIPVKVQMEIGIKKRTINIFFVQFKALRHKNEIIKWEECRKLTVAGYYRLLLVTICDPNSVPYLATSVLALLFRLEGLPNLASRVCTLICMSQTAHLVKPIDSV